MKAAFIGSFKDVSKFQSFKKHKKSKDFFVKESPTLHSNLATN